MESQTQPIDDVPFDADQTWKTDPHDPDATWPGRRAGVGREDLNPPPGDVPA